MSEIIVTNSESPFDSIRQFDEQGNEWWSARDLFSILGYPRWADAKDVIERAKASCTNSQNHVYEHFSGMTLKSKGRPKEDVRLTRSACYLVAQNGDPSKEEIAIAQTYFAIKTREAEKN